MRYKQSAALNGHNADYKKPKGTFEVMRVKMKQIKRGRLLNLSVSA